MERDLTVDIAKGIGIIFVIVGHLNHFFSYEGLVLTIIYSFHMPLFLALSGYVFNYHPEISTKEYCWRRFGQIMKPYFVFAVITYIFDYVKSGGENAGGIYGILIGNGIDNHLNFNIALWFLPMLFCCNIVFWCSVRISKRVRKELSSYVFLVLLSVFWTLLGYYAIMHQVRFYWGVETALFSQSFMLLGYTFRLLNEKYCIDQKHKKVFLCCVPAIAIIWWKGAKFNGRIDMNAGHYGNIFLFFGVAICGIYLVWQLSYLVSKIPFGNTVLNRLGKDSLYIMAYHIPAAYIVYNIILPFMPNVIKNNAWKPNGIGISYIVIVDILIAMFMRKLHERVTNVKNKTLNNLVIGEENAQGFTEKVFTIPKQTICILGLFVCCGLFQILRCIDYPGIYLDAVNPDYLAVQFLYPQTKNPTWLLPHTGIPFLGQLYHGTVTVWLQILSVGLMGGASILSLRIANMIYVIAIGWTSYLICKQIGINKVIATVGVSIMILSPQVYSFVRTQYYIKLPGTLFLFLSIYCLLLLNKNRDRAGTIVLISGLLCGLAFYSYFIYLFFVPAMLILCLFMGENRKQNGRNILNWLSGFVCGSVCYVIGYFDLLITCSGLDYTQKKILVYFFAAVMVGICSYICISIAKNFDSYLKLKKIYTFFCFLLFIAVMIIILNWNYIASVITPYIEALDVVGTKMDFTERIEYFWRHWFGVMTNSYQEQLMLGRTTSVLSKAYSVFFVMLSFCVGMIVIKFKKKNATVKMIGIWGVLLCSYFLCSLIFISRMNGQHFTPLFFIMHMIMVLEIDYLHSLGNGYCKAFSNSVLAIMIVISITNSNLLNTNLEIVGGNGLYSSQLNELSQGALDNKKAGKKEVYIFPEWGFFCGFNYLTMNQIPIMLEMDVNKLNEFIAKGYTFQLCAWDCEMEETYRNILDEVGVWELETEHKFSNDGSEAFYILKCR